MTFLSLKRGVIVGICAAFLLVGLMTKLVAYGAGKPFQGQSITVSMYTSATADAVKTLIPEFEDRTGAKVRIDEVPAAEIFEKTMTAAAGRAGMIDVYMVGYEWLPNLLPGKYLQPLNEFIKPGDEELGLDDFEPTYFHLFKREGKIYGFPIYAAVPLLFYRKDLFQKEGIAVPQTDQEFLEVAKHFTRDTDNDGKVDFWGTVAARKRGWANVCWWLHDLYKHGGDVIRGQFMGVDPGKDLKPILNNEKGIAATKFYKEKEKYMPPGIGTYEFFEALQVFMNGKVAMVIYWNDGANITEDPSRSKIAGKVGYALVPAHNGNRTVFLGGWGAVMSADSKNKKLAFEYMKWIYGKRNSKRFALAGGQPPRISVFTDPELQKKFSWFAASLEQLPSTRPYPLFVEWPQMLDIISENLSFLYIGQKSVEHALNDAAERIEELMKRAGYYK